MDTLNPKSSGLGPPSSSCSSALESTSSLLSTTSKPAAKSRPVPTSDQDDTSPRKRPRSGIPSQAPSSNTVPTLLPISPERDGLTDSDYKLLDKRLFEALSLYRKINEVPSLTLLLCFICAERRLVSLSLDEGSELLKHEPSIRGMLRDGWQAGSFKKVRQLGVFPVQQSKIIRFN
jgi:hypothetical protein